MQTMVLHDLECFPCCVTHWHTIPELRPTWVGLYLVLFSFALGEALLFYRFARNLASLHNLETPGCFVNLSGKHPQRCSVPGMVA